SWVVGWDRQSAQQRLSLEGQPASRLEVWGLPRAYSQSLIGHAFHQIAVYLIAVRACPASVMPLPLRPNCHQGD
ncbi:hypothetical protein, partial [Deinococcus marmoris]|uniref:hypothetical protein n=1 Tax=Deinococcus marmoris TaxID=249408 RepID=UPI0039F08160